MPLSGQKPPIPMKPISDIPIIGQPYQLKAVIPTTMLQCGEDQEPILLIGVGASAKCPRCGKIFVLRSVECRPDGASSASIDVGIERQVAKE